MLVVCTDGTELRAGSFKAVDSGVILYSDETRDRVMGFVAADEVKYLLPDDDEHVVARAESGSAATDGADGPNVAEFAERVGEFGSR
ncbi:hypothetical protein ACFQE1_21225, partial [Halobium palmae]